MRRFSGWFFGIGVTLYCLLVLYLCVYCPWFLDTTTDTLEKAQPWINVWMGMTVAVVCYLLFVSRITLRPVKSQRRKRIRLREVHETVKNRRTIFLGLVGGFLTALPALAITILGLIVSVPHFLEGMNDSGTLSALPSSKEASQGVALPTPPVVQPSAYLLAVDLSKSSIANASDGRLLDICGFAETLFSRGADGLLYGLVKESDVYLSFVFAKRQQLMHRSDEPFLSLRSDDFPVKFCNSLKEVASQVEVNDEGIGRSKTDIVSFMEAIIARLGTVRSAYSHVTLVVFSDFRQDVDIHSQFAIKERIRTAMGRAAEIGNVHIVGVKVPDKVTATRPSGIDIRPYLNKYGIDQSGEQKLWREIDLAEFAAEEDDWRKATLAFSMYQEIRHNKTLYLKYQIAPAWRSIQSRLKFPEEDSYDQVLLGLRASRDGDDALSRVRIAFGDPRENPFVLGEGVREPSFEIYERPKSAPTELPVTLFSRLDVSRSVECDLLVAVPATATVYAIRLIVVPTMGRLPFDILRSALSFAAIMLVLLLLGAIGVNHGVERRWSWLQRRIRAYRSSKGKASGRGAVASGETDLLK